MPSSTSSSESFFGRGVALLVVAATVALTGAHLAGRFYAPQPLAPAPSAVAASDRFLVVFGNSRTEAGIDPRRLGRALGDKVGVAVFSGGGWDAIHFDFLSLLSAPVLRPGRDGAIIEVSMLSLDDSSASNRLGVVRPEAAREIATLPGAPVELRLDMLAGAVATLYRYRISVQARALAPPLEALAARVGDRLARLGLVGEPRVAPRFQMITAPGRDFVIAEVRGDRAAFSAVNRGILRATVPALRFGGYKLAALTHAVERLRARGIAVYLVEVPNSRWMKALLATNPAYGDYKRALRALAARTGAHYLDAWPDALTDESCFFDDTHMVAATTNAFTDALAEVLRTQPR